MKFKIFFYLFFLFHTSVQSQIQFKSHFIWGIDFYQWYRNPKIENIDASNTSAGSALLCGPWGLKFAVGQNNFSLSAEAAANLGLFAFDLSDFKGLGAVSFPLLIKANFGALSGLSKNKLIGMSVGGGIQYNRTELLGTTNKYKHLHREYFPTYVGEIDLGGGIGGFNLSYYIRIGAGKNKSLSINNGLLFQFSLFNSKKSTSKSAPKHQI